LKDREVIIQTFENMFYHYFFYYFKGPRDFTHCSFYDIYL